MISQDNQKLAQFNAEAIPVDVIWKRAKLKASDAVMEYVEKNGEPMYCGFANIKIKPARGRLVKYLKENNMGSTSSYGGGGYRVSYYELMDDNNPYYRTQSMDIREVACDAACKVLASYGILCFMESRAD